jgi:hypothetical protein
MYKLIYHTQNKMTSNLEIEHFEIQISMKL